MLASLFLEVNAGVIALMIVSAVAHQLTVIWDLYFTAPRRVIPPGEQEVHTFMEMVPFLLATAAICSHWEQFLALIGRGSERPGFELHRARPALSPRRVVAVLAGMGLFGALPNLDELRRRRRAQERGLTGADTPECARELFA